MSFLAETDVDMHDNKPFNYLYKRGGGLILQRLQKLKF